MGMYVKRWALMAGVCVALWGAGPEVERARNLYNLTDFDRSLKILEAIPVKDAATYELIGRDYYMQGEYKKATEALEKAGTADPTSSEIALWTGRAYGRRAETSSPLTALGYAGKTRQYFEKAVQLNPRNLEALSDLFEFYLEAPGLVGGGKEKAQGLAARIAKVDAGEGHWAQAKLAEKRKDPASAEQHWRQALDASPTRVGRFIDLARFLARQGRFEEADDYISRAEKIAPNTPKLLYAKADLYIQHRRNLQVAKDILTRYMAMNLTPDDPPRSAAAKLLRQVQGG